VIGKSIRLQPRRAEPARRERTRERSPSAQNASYVHARPSPMEKTAVQPDVSGKLLGNLLPAREQGKRFPAPCPPASLGA
jgi:hypothetical protein